MGYATALEERFSDSIRRTLTTLELVSDGVGGGVKASEASRNSTAHTINESVRRSVLLHDGRCLKKNCRQTTVDGRRDTAEWFLPRGRRPLSSQSVHGASLVSPGGGQAVGSSRLDESRVWARTGAQPHFRWFGTPDRGVA